MRKTYETPRTIVVGKMTVHVVERTRVSAHRVGNRLWFQGRKDFTSIVVDVPEETHKFTWEMPRVTGERKTIPAVNRQRAKLA